MGVHINANPGDVAETVLMPGDPLRAKWIAETFLEDAKCYNTVRNMLGYTGTYKGVPVSVQGSGMGLPSFSIYAHELIHDYGAKKLIRVGSAGAMQEDVKLRDVVIAMSASTTSSINRSRFDGGDYAPTASFNLFKKALKIADEKNIDVKAGTFYHQIYFTLMIKMTIKSGQHTMCFALKWKLLLYIQLLQNLMLMP